MIKDWHHAPRHLFLPNQIYMVTAATHQREPFFRGPERLDLLQRTTFDRFAEAGWHLQAWAFFPNHYHLVLQSPENAPDLAQSVRAVHSISAREINRLDGTERRKVWFQYWDTCITNERSHFARLNYVHTNPVKHGVAANAEDYRWCSMAAFLKTAEAGFQRTVLSFPIDRLKVPEF